VEDTIYVNTLFAMVNTVFLRADQVPAFVEMMQGLPCHRVRHRCPLPPEVRGWYTDARGHPHEDASKQDPEERGWGIGVNGEWVRVHFEVRGMYYNERGNLVKKEPGQGSEVRNLYYDDTGELYFLDKGASFSVRSTPKRERDSSGKADAAQSLSQPKKQCTGDHSTPRAEEVTRHPSPGRQSLMVVRPALSASSGDPEPVDVGRSLVTAVHLACLTTTLTIIFTSCGDHSRNGAGALFGERVEGLQRPKGCLRRAYHLV
jgi:hypothetical protein